LAWGFVNPAPFSRSRPKTDHPPLHGGGARRSSRASTGKPELKAASTRSRFPESFTQGAATRAAARFRVLQGARWDRPPMFAKYGAIRARRSPATSRRIAGIADDICNHPVDADRAESTTDPAHAFMNSGSIIKGRPSMGSWLLYGLGSEADDPPWVHRAHVGGQVRPAAPSRRGKWSGRLPAQQSFQGILFSSRKGDAGPLHRQTPTGVLPEARRSGQVIEGGQPPQTALPFAEGPAPTPRSRPGSASTRMAFRMQTSVAPEPDRTSRARPQHILDLYGVKQARATASFASNCLPAGAPAGGARRPPSSSSTTRAWDHHLQPWDARHAERRPGRGTRASAALVKGT